MFPTPLFVETLLIHRQQPSPWMSQMVDSFGVPADVVEPSESASLGGDPSMHNSTPFQHSFVPQPEPIIPQPTSVPFASPASHIPPESHPSGQAHFVPEPEPQPSFAQHRPQFTPFIPPTRPQFIPFIPPTLPQQAPFVPNATSSIPEPTSVPHQPSGMPSALHEEIIDENVDMDDGTAEDGDMPEAESRGMEFDDDHQERASDPQYSPSVSEITTIFGRYS